VQERGVEQDRRQFERQRGAGRGAIQRHVERLDAVDVRRRVVDRGVVRHRVGAAIRDRDERVPARVSDARADAAEQVAGDAVLQRARRGVRAVGPVAGDLADRDQIDRGAGEVSRRATDAVVGELAAAQGGRDEDCNQDARA
jgi:hypothetical protein